MIETIEMIYYQTLLFSDGVYTMEMLLNHSIYFTAEVANTGIVTIHVAKNQLDEVEKLI